MAQLFLAPSFVNLMLESEQIKPLADDKIFHILKAILSRIISQNRRRNNGAKNGKLGRVLERQRRKWHLSNAQN